MVIGIAGPYSAPTPEERRRNLATLNRAAVKLWAIGHTPIIGVNTALPVARKLPRNTAINAAIMDISLAVMTCCDALLLLAESPGALRERDLFLQRGLPVYYSLEEVPRGAQSVL